MLAAVESENSRYENLRNYITGNKRPPTFVSAPNTNPRLATKPGEPVPGVSGRIPVSSQRPGKRTNETVPYARMQFTEFQDSAVDVSDMLPGDVIMVYKSVASLGHDSNRVSKCATWRQINTLLKQAKTGATLERGMEAKLVQSRKQLLAGIDSSSEHVEFDETFYALEKQGLSSSFDKDNKVVKSTRQMLEDSIKNLKSKDPSATIMPLFDLHAVSLFQNWVPDGVLLSRDDDEHNASYFHAGGGDSGTVLNIAIQGPCMCRNSSVREDKAELVQLFDTEARIRDALYIVVICTLNSDGRGNFVNYSFELKPTSSRILEELITRGDRTADPDKGYPFQDSLSWKKLKNICYAWKIGTVMDNKLVHTTESKILLNVAVSPLTLFDLQATFSTDIGSGIVDVSAF